MIETISYWDTFVYYAGIFALSGFLIWLGSTFLYYGIVLAMRLDLVAKRVINKAWRIKLSKMSDQQFLDKIWELNAIHKELKKDKDESCTS